jgi:hypothetical protein
MATPGTFYSYNGYTHLPGEVKAAFHIEMLKNEAEYPIAQLIRIELEGRLLASSAPTGSEPQVYFTSQINALRQAYVSGGNFLMTLNAGSTSPLSVFDGKTLGGVRVVRGPEFPDLGKAQYAAILDYAITLEAEVPVTGAASFLWSFTESLEFEGDGGSATDVLVPQTGLPVPQTLKQFTPMRAVQRGEVVGYLYKPTVPSPLWPRPIYQGQYTKLGKVTPHAIGRGKDRAYKLYSRSWEYHFVSPTPLDADPTLWPTNQ